MKIAFLSDSHIGLHPKTTVKGRVPFANLQLAVDELLEESPDLVIHAGDGSLHKGTAASYALLDEALAPIREASVPIHFILGNHDNPDQAPKEWGQLRTIRVGSGMLVLLNTQIGLHVVPGKIGKNQFAEIERLTLENPDAPLVLVGHHHPELRHRTDLVAPDIGLYDTEEFLTFSDRIPNLRAYIHGHSHSWHLDQTPGGKKLINLGFNRFRF